jgi:hypothetical protein
MIKKILFWLCMLSALTNLAYLSQLSLSWALIPIALLAWYVADAQSGLIHMYMDYRPCTANLGLKELFFYQGSRASKDYQELLQTTMRRVSFFERVVYDFKNHHPRPNALGRRNFEQQTLSLSIFLLPYSLISNLILWSGHLPDLLALGLIIFLTGSMLTQYFHGTLHRDNNPWIINLMRRAGLLIKPHAHDVHHATLDCDFATISGWSNPLLNRVFHHIQRRGGFDRKGLEPE